jgi:hypothetical protein
MQIGIKRKLAIGTTVLAAAAFAGGAYAARNDSPESTRQAFLNDVAKRLKVAPAKLTAALRGAFFDQLDAAVAAGKLTKTQADAIKQRTLLDRRSAVLDREINRSGAPRFGPRGYFRQFGSQLGPGRSGPAGAAASPAAGAGGSPSPAGSGRPAY